MVGFKLDRYTWGAQVLPVYLTAAPGVLAVATTLPEELNLPLAGASAQLNQPRFPFRKSTQSGRLPPE